MSIAGRARDLPTVLLLFGAACASSTPQLHAQLHDVQASLGAVAEDAAPTSVAFDGSLESYTAFAYARSPALRASFETWRAATHQPDQERRMPEPTISYTAFVRAIETRVGPQRHRLSASQRFPWPTTLRAGGEAASLEAIAAQRRFEAHALRVAAEVAQAYWALWRIERELEVHQAEIEVLQSLSEQVRGRVAVGTAELSDLAQIDLQLSRARDRHASLQRHRRAASATLVQVVGAPDQVATPVERREPRAEPLAETTTGLAVSAADHPDVRAFSRLSEAAGQRARQARAQRAPSFALGVDWILTGPSSVTPAPADDGKDAVGVSLSVQVPLWTRAYRAAGAQAQAEAAAHRSRAIDARNGVVADVRRHAELVDDAARRVAFYDSTLLPQGATAFESVLASYATGRSSVAELLLAERALLSLRSERFGALADYGVELARLERAVGRPVERASSGETERAP